MSDLWEGLSPPYRTIVADPPWQSRGNGRALGSAGVGTGLDRSPIDARPESRYSTLNLDAICSLPVADLAATNAHLYLWATCSGLDDAIAVVRSWGFVYKTTITWVKKLARARFGRVLPYADGACDLRYPWCFTDEHYRSAERVRGSANGSFTKARPIWRHCRAQLARPLRRTVRACAASRLGFMGQRLRGRVVTADDRHALTVIAVASVALIVLLTLASFHQPARTSPTTVPEPVLSSSTTLPGVVCVDRHGLPERSYLADAERAGLSCPTQGATK